jgi:malate dehydrogenase (oxaloacetate-decarboxylating)(NADP+)
VPVWLKFGRADALISGLTKNYVTTVKPALQIIGTEEGCNRVAGMYMMITAKGPVFFGDTTVNVNPSVQRSGRYYGTDRTLGKAGLTSAQGWLYYPTPTLAQMKAKIPEKTRETVSILHEKYPDMVIDGDMQANFAMNTDLLAR